MAKRAAGLFFSDAESGVGQFEKPKANVNLTSREESPRTSTRHIFRVPDNPPSESDTANTGLTESGNPLTA